MSSIEHPAPEPPEIEHPVPLPPVDPTQVDDPDLMAANRISRRRLVFRRFWRPASTKVGLAGLVAVLILALFGNFLAQWSFEDVDNTSFLKGPSGAHWFGTTQGGRDVFAMVIQGLRQSLVIGFTVALIQTMLAALIGAAAAYFGGAFEFVVLWLIDLLLVIPGFLLIAVMSQQFAGAQGSITMFIVLLASLGWMLSARVVRAMTKSVVELDYVNSAKFMSVPSRVIIVRHIIPNISSYLIVYFTLGVVGAIMSETTLSYFGFGVQSPNTSLGTLLAEGAPRATTSSWIFLAPAVVLVIILLSVNFLGDSLRDALDPSSKSGGQA